MTILIKGMDMPEGCRDCELGGVYIHRDANDVYAEEKCRCSVTFYPLKDLTKRHEHCPLIEVPTPHGRLIDAGALLERFEKEEKAADEHGRDFSFSFKSGGENCTEWWPVQQMLMDAPTVIEAEK